jgi:glycosyltransferase involved in cell wall biosynthesis
VTGPLEALKLLKEKGIEAELQIGGRMTWEGALEEVNQMINDFNLDKSVKILGSYTQDEAVKIYQDNDILLHFQYNDASPTVPLEAMSTGMPVVSTNSGGLAEIIDSKCGELIEVEKSYEKMVYPKSSEITTAIAKIIDNYDSYSKEAAKWTRGNFEVFSWLEKHKLIFENIIKNA